jgi:hypothetical protein
MNIVWGVISGLITFGLIELIRLLCKMAIHRNFKKVFGTDIGSEQDFHLIYAHLILSRDIIAEDYPYRKPGEERSGAGFSIERPVSSCEIRAAKYLSESIAREVKKGPSLSSDIDLKEKLDVSFISFGGPGSNFKTRDLIDNESNDLINFGEGGFKSIRTGKPLKDLGSGLDCGLILKINPKQFPDRTWLTCAGLGEWGTSGAAWYLANKWKKIQALAKNSSFAIIVRVKEGQDESADPVLKVKSSQELQEYEQE